MPRKRRGGQGMAFDQGASRPQSTITAKSKGAPQNAWRLKLKKIQRIQRNIDEKKLVSSFLFFILIIFLFSAKSGGGGAKKWWGRGPTSPSPSAVPVSSPMQKEQNLIYTKNYTI